MPKIAKHGDRAARCRSSRRKQMNIQKRQAADRKRILHRVKSADPRIEARCSKSPGNAPAIWVQRSVPPLLYENGVVWMNVSGVLHHNNFFHLNNDSSVKNPLGSDLVLFWNRGFDPEGVKNAKLFEAGDDFLAFSLRDRNPRKGMPERVNLIFYGPINIESAT